MSRRGWWTLLFLGVTSLAVGGELLAAFDRSDDTVPWTGYLADLSLWLTLPAALILVVWLPTHIIRARRQRLAERDRTPMEVAVVTPLAVPPDAHSDAKNRAWRTFAQGLLVDLTVATVTAVGPILVSNDFAFTREYWALVGALAAKTAVMTVVSYVARRVMPPQV